MFEEQRAKVAKFLDKAENRLWLETNVTRYDHQPQVLREGRQVIRTEDGKPLEFAMTGVSREKNLWELMDVPPELRQLVEFPPAIVLEAKSKEEALERLDRREEILSDYANIGAVRLVDEANQRIRYVATGIPKLKQS